MRRSLAFGSLGVAAAMTVSAMLTVLAGCASAWESNFQPTAGAAIERGSPDSLVRVRRVPWERLNATLVNLERDLVESDVHPSEWPADRLRARDGEVLRALQISEGPDRARILGRSVFRSTRPVTPDDGELEAFARKIGADYAVWSSRYEGKTLVTDRQPVTTQGFVWDGYGDRRGFYRGGGSYTETTFVPVVVEADEYAWIAYFVRVGP